MPKTEFFKNILLLIFTVVIFLIIFEVALRIINPSVNDTPIKYIPTNDIRNYENKPGVTYSLNEVAYRINNDGLRSDTEYPKIKIVPRIALMGDSVTFGSNVNVNDTFGYLLQKDLKQYEIINFGVPGYDSAAEIQTLKVKALPYHPDIVILNFVMNDIEPSTILFNENTVPEKCILPVINLGVSCKIKTMITSSRAVNFFYTAFKNIFYNKVTDYYTLSWSNDELYNSNIAKPIKEFKSICELNKLKCGVVIFPLLQFNSTYYRWEAQENKIKNELKSLGLPYVTIRDTYQRYNSSQVGGTKDDILHPNAFGHKVAEPQIAKFISQIS